MLKSAANLISETHKVCHKKNLRIEDLDFKNTICVELQEIFFEGFINLTHWKFRIKCIFAA